MHARRRRGPEAASGGVYHAGMLPVSSDVISEPSPPSPDWAQTLRDAMAVSDVYLDHAACSPLPRATAAAMTDYVTDFAERGSARWPRWRSRVEDARSRLAAMLDCDAASLAMVRNTTEGITIVAEGIDWQPGDNVVVPADEFPSNLFPWRNLESRGVECRVVKAANGRSVRLDPTPLRDACDARTRVIACSWVGYKLGDRADIAALREIANDAGAELFIDAIQGLGMHPIDLSLVDYLAADGHKWLLGPEGAGTLYIAPHRLASLRPIGVGWNSVAEAASFDGSATHLRDDAARYEGGTYPAVTMVGLAASLDVLSGATPADREARLHDLTDHLRDAVEQRGGRIVSPNERAHRTAITAVDVGDRDPAAMRSRGLKAGIVTSVRGGLLRLAPHAYQTPDDLGLAVKVLWDGSA